MIIKVRHTEARCDFEDIPPGTYALVVIHDENMNGKLDTNWVGIPKEGYGFSNDVKPCSACLRSLPQLPVRRGNPGSDDQHALLSDRCMNTEDFHSISFPVVTDPFPQSNTPIHGYCA